MREDDVRRSIFKKIIIILPQKWVSFHLQNVANSQRRMLLLHFQEPTACADKCHQHEADETAVETDGDKRRDAVVCKEGLKSLRSSSFQHRIACS